MRQKNNYLVAVANNGKLRQRFMPGVPRTFDHDCSVHRQLRCASLTNVHRQLRCASLTSVHRQLGFIILNVVGLKKILFL